VNKLLKVFGGKAKWSLVITAVFMLSACGSQGLTDDEAKTVSSFCVKFKNYQNFEVNASDRIESELLQISKLVTAHPDLDSLKALQESVNLSASHQTWVRDSVSKLELDGSNSLGLEILTEGSLKSYDEIIGGGSFLDLLGYDLGVPQTSAVQIQEKFIAACELLN